MSTNLEISREGRLLRVAMNRPEKRNALSAGLCRDLVKVIGDAEADRAVGAILLEARGPIFCAGMDLDEAREPGAPERTAIHEQLFTTGARLVKPLIAAVQGPAYGGGLGLVANAHIVLAAQGVTFGLTEIRVGMWPFVVFRAVSGAIGERRALELSLTGRIFSAQEALAWGLVQHLAPAVEFEDRALHLAQTVAGASPEIVRLGMEFVRETRGLPPPEAGRIAQNVRSIAFSSEDFAEGVRAFQEKRPPHWPSLK